MYVLYYNVFCGFLCIHIDAFLWIFQDLPGCFSDIQGSNFINLNCKTWYFVVPSRLRLMFDWSRIFGSLFAVQFFFFIIIIKNHVLKCMKKYYSVQVLYKLYYRYLYQFIFLFTRKKPFSTQKILYVIPTCETIRKSDKERRREKKRQKDEKKNIVEDRK